MPAGVGIVTAVDSQKSASAKGYSGRSALPERRGERVKGIEPSSVAWKATALPLSYTRERGKLTRLPAAAKSFLEAFALSPLRDLIACMKALAFSLAVIAALSLSARADFTIVQKVEKKEAKGKNEGGEITLKVKGDKIRMDPSPKMTMIVDGKTGDTITLLNEQKKVVRISGEKAKAIAEMAAKYGGKNTEKPKLTPTGKKMTINGYEADEYVAESKTF